MRFPWLLVFLVGCLNHQNCGENGAGEYAHFLDPKASCFSLRMGSYSGDDYALCSSRSATMVDEQWLCSGEPWCRVLGPPIKVQRVP